MSMTRNRSRTAAPRRGKRPGRLGGALRSAAGMLGGARPGARGRKRRGRGITATELRGFNKVSGLLGRWGMAPRKMRGARKVSKRK